MPYLKPHHFTHRFEFAAAELQRQEEAYKRQPHRVHMDEKWFFIMEENERLWIFPEEELPERYVRNKQKMRGFDSGIQHRTGHIALD